MIKPAHHHGDLRNALIQAGLEILDTEGLEKLTLRKAAARAGVSHAAPAHHFPGKEGLLQAIAAHGYDQFSELMREERFRNGETPRDQLEGISRGYIRFSREHPALFRLVFSVEYKNSPQADLLAASERAFQILSHVCALFEQTPFGPRINELKVWSVVHGYAALSQYRRGNSPETGEPVPIELLLPDLKPRSK
jgi:AcrR family transcriptional regulator